MSRRKTSLLAGVRIFDSDDVCLDNWDSDKLNSVVAASDFQQEVQVTVMNSKDEATTVPSPLFHTGQQQLSQPTLIYNKVHWTPEEDEKLKLWVERNGEKEWIKMSEILPYRTARECRDRWKTHLNPYQKKYCSWTETEDDKGSRWSDIGKQLLGRMDLNIKNHRNSVKSWNRLKTTIEDYECVSDSVETPHTSSELSFQEAQPVRLFSTPKTPPRQDVSQDAISQLSSVTKREDETPPGSSTPLSLGIGSPDYLLSSPSQWLSDDMVGTSSNSALLSELEALFHTDGSSFTNNMDLHLLDTPPNTRNNHFNGIKGKSLGFQIGAKSLGSLTLCSPNVIGLNQPVADEMCPIMCEFQDRKAEDLRDSRMTDFSIVRRLRFDTPCILRKRKRRRTCFASPSRTKISSKVSNSGSSFDCRDTLLKSYELEKSPPNIEAPFTPSRFLNSPQVVTSTPVSRKSPPLPSETVSADDQCSPHVKRLMLDDLRTPFKATVKEEEQDGNLDCILDLLIPEENEVKGDSPDILPFTSYSLLDDLRDRDLMTKAESVKNDVSTCHITLGKSLDKPLLASGTCTTLVESLISLETPSKSLVGDESLMFSPPSIIRDTLHDSLTFDQRTPSSSVSNIINSGSQTTNIGWERVACGQTTTQKELIKQAKELLSCRTELHLKPRSLQL